MSAQTPKQEAIAAFFAHREDDLARAEELLGSTRFHEEGWLVTTCHIGALASSRYPAEPDGIAFTRFVTDYSADSTFWTHLDFLFLYQWPRSQFRNHGSYTRFTKYAEVHQCFEFGDGRQSEGEPNPRFVPYEEALARIRRVNPELAGERGLNDWLKLFTVVEQLYRYVRCGAVHDWHFPFVTPVRQPDGSTRYDQNHLITADKLIETAKNLKMNLEAECIAKSCWPGAL